MYTSSALLQIFHIRYSRKYVVLRIKNLTRETLSWLRIILYSYSLLTDININQQSRVTTFYTLDYRIAEDIHHSATQDTTIEDTQWTVPHVVLNRRILFEKTNEKVKEDNVPIDLLLNNQSHTPLIVSIYRRPLEFHPPKFSSEAPPVVCLSSSPC